MKDYYLLDKKELQPLFVKVMLLWLLLLKKNMLILYQVINRMNIIMLGISSKIIFLMMLS